MVKVEKAEIAPDPEGDALLSGIVSGNFVLTPGQRIANTLQPMKY